jgi:hypothetical protein
VRYLLEGSVRRLGDKVEVNAQLISTETGAHVWADRFDGEKSKLGELQVEFVSRLANSRGRDMPFGQLLGIGVLIAMSESWLWCRQESATRASSAVGRLKTVTAVQRRTASLGMLG